MGLTIHFTLRLPASFTQDAVTGSVAKLRQACHRLPFQGQTAMVTFDEARIRAAIDGAEALADWRWACIQYTRKLYYAHDHNGVPYVLAADAQAQETIHARVTAKTLVGFTLMPGNGCAPLNLYVGAYPTSMMTDCRGAHHGYPSGKSRLMLRTPLRWTGSAFCKTQYSSHSEYGGITNFLRCHLAVVAALDAARDLGFAVEVRDDGGYWTKRSVPDLVREVGDWNTYRMCAGQRLRTIFGETVNIAIIESAMSKPVYSAAAADQGDDVLDLIRRTAGTCTPSTIAAPA